MIIMWWDILKNAKLSAKGKGKTLDTSRLKVNIQYDKCKEKLRELIMQKPLNAGTHIYDNWEQMPEEVACLIIKDLQNITLDSKNRKVENYMGYEVRYWNKLNHVINEKFGLTGGLLVRCVVNKKITLEDKMVFELYVFSKSWEEWRKLL